MKHFSACLLLLLAWAFPAVAPAQSLTVTLLGTGIPRPDIDRFGPSILVEAGPAKLLFDCGRGASQRLWQRRLPLGAVNPVFFTHLHSDHVVGFPDLWLTGMMQVPHGQRAVPLQVFGPAGTAAMVAGLRQAYAWDLRVRPASSGPGSDVVATDITEGVVYEQGGVKVTAFLVEHGANLQPALGYRVDYGGHAVVLSGDTGFSENLIRFAQGADVVVHEVAAAPETPQGEAVRYILSTHTQPEEAGRIFSRVKPALAVYSHIALLNFDPQVPPVGPSDLLRRTRTTYAGRVEVGEDRMWITIGPQVTVHRVAPPRLAKK
jgi:ribonuclease Z